MEKITFIKCMTSKSKTKDSLSYLFNLRVTETNWNNTGHTQNYLVFFIDQSAEDAKMKDLYLLSIRNMPNFLFLKNL